MASELPPVPDDPVRPPPVRLGDERPLRIVVGPRVELDARLLVPVGATAVAVLCHPHPLYGGTMHNAVVVSVARALAEQGVASLRFDFRGVGASSGVHDDGRGEVDDVDAALRAACEELPGAALRLCGYSFGAACALRSTLRGGGRPGPAGGARPDRLALVAPVPRPLRLDPEGLSDAAVASLPESLVVAADRDPFAEVAEVEALARRLGARFEVVPGEHFFVGSRRRVAELVAGFFAGGGEPR